MVITILSIGTLARVKTMHITSDDQGSSEYAVVIDLQMNMVKYIIGEEITG